jgi:hypothetical protein
MCTLVPDASVPTRLSGLSDFPCIELRHCESNAVFVFIISPSVKNLRFLTPPSSEGGKQLRQDNMKTTTDQSVVVHFYFV